MVSHLL